jgi:excisionase family DNA binding protein
MDYISTKEAAKQWGVSIRYVQHLLSENRIPGAKKYGVSWLIPMGSKKPRDPRKERRIVQEKKYIFYSFAPISKSDHSLEEQPEELQPLASAYYAYYRGEYEPAKRCWRETPRGADTKLTAASLAMAAAMSTGDYTLYDEIQSGLKAETERARTSYAKTLLSFPSTMAAVCMGAPGMAPDWLKSGDFADFPADIRPHLIYLYLMYLRSTEHYDQLLVAAKMACSVYGSEDTFSHLDLYFALLCAVAANALNDADTALCYIDRAARLAIPHGFLAPFAEYLPGLGGLIETYLEQEFPAELRTVLKLAPQLWKNWMDFHNKYTKDNITTILSPQEYHVALLLSRGATYAQTAKRLNLSVSRIRNIVSDVYGKLYVNNKQEMCAFIL